MIKKTLLLIMLLGVFASCNHIDNKVLPSYTVRIDLGTYGVWNTYGVTGVGDYRIFSRDKQLPANFPYNANTFTGFGGVLLIMGLDTSTGSYAPLAFDAACPVERRPDTRSPSTPPHSMPFAPNAARTTTCSMALADRSQAQHLAKKWGSSPTNAANR